MSVEQEVMERISPSTEYRENLDRAVYSITEKVAYTASKMGLDVEVLPVGSVAKDTYLTSTDIDIFILFDKDLPNDVLERDGLEIGKRVLEGEERYAEHPYVHGEHMGFEVDIVPCYKIDDTKELKSAVDRIPFYLRFVQENLAPDGRDQVRLLKQFMKGVGVYGAEARVEGFSGYLSELLVMRFGTFRSVLENAKEWSHGKTLWIGEKGSASFKDPLVFYDPVDGGRNVASALSVDSFSRFIHASREFLREERIEFFFPRDRQPLPKGRMMDMISERGTSVVLVSFERPDIIEDNLFPQVRKTYEGLLALLTEHDFVVVDSSFFVDDGVFLIFELEEDVLTRCRRHTGPPVWIDHSVRFLEKWSEKGMSAPFIERGRWIVLVEREYTNPIDLLEGEVNAASLGSEFKILRGFDVQGGEEVFNDENRPALSSLLDKRFPWDI
jgi:tRNA nucleotidyltransferase (CCA-adding enzyme)